jgi:hypothetical protein
MSSNGGPELRRRSLSVLESGLRRNDRDCGLGFRRATTGESVALLHQLLEPFAEAHEVFLPH